MNAAERAELSIVLDVVRDVKNDLSAFRTEVNAHLDKQDTRIAAIERKQVAQEAVTAAAENAAEKARMHTGRVVAIGAAVGSVVVGVAGLVLRVMGVIH